MNQKDKLEELINELPERVRGPLMAAFSHEKFEDIGDEKKELLERFLTVTDLLTRLSTGEASNPILALHLAGEIIAFVGAIFNDETEHEALREQLMGLAGWEASKNAGHTN